MITQKEKKIKYIGGKKMNHVVLMGRLAKDPELKYSQTGKAFSKFTVAVNREFNREEADLKQ